MKKTHILSAILFVATISILIDFKPIQIVYASTEPSNYALCFNGASDYVKSSNVSWDSIQDDLSFLVWIKTPENRYDQERTIIGNLVEAGSYNIALCFYDWDGDNNTDLWFYSTKESGYSETDLYSSQNISDNNWHFLVAVRDKSGGKDYLYIDGIEVANQTDEGGTLDPVNDPTYWYLGGNGDSPASQHYFNGTIAESYVFNRPLSQSEVTSLYNSGIGQYSPQNTANLLVSYKIDEGSGTNIFDRSGDGTHGTIYGASWDSGFPPDWYAFEEFYIQTDYNTTLSTVSYTTERLKLTISANSGITSTTYVYCGTKGEPKSVSRVASWSYNTDTKICTLSITHSSELDAEIIWAISALGVYPLSISVLQNGMPTHATVVIDRENKTVFGLTTWNLPYGNYFIMVYCGDQRQTKNILLSGPQSIGFDFKVTDPPSWGGMIWVVPALLLVGIVLYFTLFRKTG